MIHSADVRLSLHRLAVRERGLSTILSARGEPNLAAYHAGRADRYEGAAIEREIEPEAEPEIEPEIEPGHQPGRPYPFARILDEFEANLLAEIAWGCVAFVVFFVVVFMVMALWP